MRLRRYENIAAGGKLIDKYLAPAEGPGWYLYGGFVVSRRRCHLPQSPRNNTVLVQWMTRSFGLSPLDYFFWGHLKKRVYTNKPNTYPELKYESR